jgi:hypothetical protein
MQIHQRGKGRGGNRQFVCLHPAEGKNYFERLGIAWADFRTAIARLAGPAGGVFYYFLEVARLQLSEKKPAIKRKSGFGYRADRGTGVTLDTFGYPGAAVIDHGLDNLFLIHFGKIQSCH